MKAENTIFTDGSSRGNPGPGGWGAIIVFSDEKTIMNNEYRMTNNSVQEIGGMVSHTTNNRMELTAVIEALTFASKIAIPHSLFIIHLDSSYVMNGATKWIYGWQKNNWKTSTKADVLNVDLWQKLARVLPLLTIEWKLVKGHSGVPANERCDAIATSFADGDKPHLYSGNLDSYEIDLHIPVSKAQGSKLKPKSSRAPAYSYVSQVDGVIQTHGTWAECEQRVKGVKKTKFKKSISSADEKFIIDSWKTSH